MRLDDWKHFLSLVCSDMLVQTIIDVIFVLQMSTIFCFDTYHPVILKLKRHNNLYSILPPSQLSCHTLNIVFSRDTRFFSWWPKSFLCRRLQRWSCSLCVIKSLKWLNLVSWEFSHYQINVKKKCLKMFHDCPDHKIQVRWSSSSRHKRLSPLCLYLICTFKSFSGHVPKHMILYYIIPVNKNKNTELMIYSMLYRVEAASSLL